jgi:hypothetical protein
MLNTITAKLAGVCLLVAGLAASTQVSGLSAAAAARIALGIAACGALAFWAYRSRRSMTARGPRFSLQPQLMVAARASLSQRCGLALVEADGARYLVAYGDGFAQLLQPQAPRRVQARTPKRASIRRARAGGVR